MNLPPPRPDDGKVWELLEDMYRWLRRHGESRRRGGEICKHLAFFVDFYLPRRFPESTPDTVLKMLTPDLLDEYLGVWYPMEAEFASPENLREQLRAFHRLAGFLEDTHRYAGASADLAELARRTRRMSRYIRRLDRWRSLRKSAVAPAEFEQACAAWLREEW
ncbi:MAG: hypothetical protein JXQ27_08250 [Acidobacteria bacterium]|nr:hypothetical protein [Acidobacteriota bacterium]